MGPRAGADGWVSAHALLHSSMSSAMPPLVRASLCLAYTNVDRSRFKCESVFGNKGCQEVFAPNKADYPDVKACEDSGCSSCREVTCHAHGECRQHAEGCDCDANYYPSSSCSVYCEPKATCHGHGTCGDAGACECDADYYPAGECTTFCNAEVTCHGNGNCAAEGTCECVGHYYPTDTCEHSVLLMGAAVAGVVSLLVVRRLHLPFVLVPAALSLSWPELYLLLAAWVLAASRSPRVVFLIVSVR
jgi:hypothetical protein